MARLRRVLLRQFATLWHGPWISLQEEISQALSRGYLSVHFSLKMKPILYKKTTFTSFHLEYHTLEPQNVSDIFLTVPFMHYLIVKCLWSFHKELFGALHSTFKQLIRQTWALLLSLMFFFASLISFVALACPCTSTHKFLTQDLLFKFVFVKTTPSAGLAKLILFHSSFIYVSSGCVVKNWTFYLFCWIWGVGEQKSFSVPIDDGLGKRGCNHRHLCLSRLC